MAMSEISPVTGRSFPGENFDENYTYISIKT